MRMRELAYLHSASNTSFDDVFDLSKLYEAGKKCCNNSRWKSSTIFFEDYMLSLCAKQLKNLTAGINTFKGFNSFKTMEHGKERDIDAVAIEYRTPQKCLCNNMLIDAYSRTFIYDNASSLKNKGIDFAIRRLKKHLHDHFVRCGLEGGILQFDFSKYFASIPHWYLKDRANRVIRDTRLRALVHSYIDNFRLLRNADPEKAIGVGLGSEISQILALDAASYIDHYITEVFGIKGYARYMDDGYVISDSIDKLKDIREYIFHAAAEKDLIINPKKTIITPFKSHGFKFLKIRFRLMESGKILMKMNRKSIKQMRQKLIKFRYWLDEGRMTFDDIYASYQSWRACSMRCDSYTTIKNMDEYFIETFAEEARNFRVPIKCFMHVDKNKYNEYEYSKRS